MIRLCYVMLTYAALAGTLVAAFVHPRPRLLWNTTSSVPLGLYMLQSPGRWRVGDLAVISPPAPLARALDRGGYLPLGVPLLKPVAALPGQQVCRRNLVVSVDGRPIGSARLSDRLGRPLPIWRGCRVIARSDLFVMNPAQTYSLDGRYFGALPASAARGRATALWLPAHRSQAQSAKEK